MQQNRKIFVIDSSVLLQDPSIIESYAGADVVVPVEVVEKIERFKKDQLELGRNARQLGRILENLRNIGNVTQGIELKHGGTFQILMEKAVVSASQTGGNGIIAHALALQEKEPKSEVSIVSSDINIRLKADSLGIKSITHNKGRFDEALSYCGYVTLEFSQAEIAEFNERGSLTIGHLKLRSNEYVSMCDTTTGKVVNLAKVAHHRNDVLVPLEYVNEELVGLKALNREQTFAIEALLDERVKLITLFGQAGTGKTLLALAAGLRQVLKDFTYQKVLVGRPVVPMGRDIGFLPGDIEEKMRPWMQPIFDALELIRNVDKRSRRPVLPASILEMEELQIEPLTYIRGRSIPNQFLIIDEAQNLSPLEAKTIITRVGKNTKIILTGDPEQIDTPYMDEFSNGLSYIVGNFRESNLAAHVHLKTGARSELAEQAVALL